MTPLQQYQQDLLRDDFYYDAAQENAVKALDKLYQNIINFEPKAENKKFIPHLLNSLFLSKKQTDKIVKGLYLYGGVGQGKTYIVDIFFHSLPTERKLRIHFHRFMLMIHQELNQRQGSIDPLESVADEFAKQYDVLCFDEFFVSDITDAMLLGTLLQALFSRGVILVATSNIEPDNLYRNGLQRARFLPAIAAINHYCDVLSVNSGVDHRLEVEKYQQSYFSPLTDHVANQLDDYFTQIIIAPVNPISEIKINNRQIRIEKESDRVAFFDFSALCESDRSALDYIEIASRYHSVFLANVKMMGSENDSAARRFIALVDEFYERRVNLIISAEVKLNDIYQQGGLSFEFDRCKSRLYEMSSEAYLQSEHLA
ncbi:AFG1 family ATPase [Vibrio sp. SS-MA-C1-2]|uniref:cell division protein ZapE n=1 Tax=Vibrio sp. SS-MA-C1-2 TaxID=2908646 RepID=UPI001EEE3C95|nr:cell division protein ZapE [Vibrio sp. SS-MA-C1-2]UJF19091.1 AFG1 family ATPase [Vibrio sp. SS-MA-C1-2]